MKPHSFQDILSRLPDAKQSGGNYIASCPLSGHDTPKGHLTLKDIGDKALVTCQGGRHSYSDYCEAWDYDSLSYSDNGSGPESNKQKTLVATFIYEYEKGKEAYQIRRFDFGNGNKTFEVWHKENGQYISGMGEYKGKPIPYHLPEIPEWIAAGKRIYIPEGEGKVDGILLKGGAATTSPFGAGPTKWMSEHSNVLTGAEIMILPDNDKPGRDFAEEKAVSLHGIAKSIKILELPGLPEKGDIIDWFAAGSTFEELEELSNKAPEWTPVDMAKRNGFDFIKLSDLLKENGEDITYLWENTLIKGGLSILVSKPKVGKSTLARNLAMKIARGDSEFLGRAITESSPVVYLALEEKRSEVKNHFKRMGVTEDLPILIHVGSAPEKAIDELRKAVIGSRAVLAIIDPLQRLLRSPDLNDYSSVSLAFEPLMEISRDTGCHILLIHHANKGMVRESGDSILGSTAIFGSVDCALIMKRNKSHRTIESIQRYGEDLPRTVLTFDVTTGLTNSGGSLEDVEIAECKESIQELLSDREMTEKEIKDGITDHKGGNVSKSLRFLYQEGKIKRQGLGKKGDPYLYSATLKNAGDAGDEYMEIPTIPTIPTIQSSFNNVSLQKTDDTLNIHETAQGEPDYPYESCSVCRGVDYWLREASPLGKPEWICSRCHPNPVGGE